MAFAKLEEAEVIEVQRYRFLEGRMKPYWRRAAVEFHSETRGTISLYWRDNGERETITVKERYRRVAKEDA